MLGRSTPCRTQSRSSSRAVRQIRDAELGRCQPEEGARCANRARRTIPDWRRAAGRRDEVDPIRHLIVTATGWGFNPDRDAICLNVTPAKNDGATIYKLNVKDVPVDGFWPISLYDADGYFGTERPQRLHPQQHHSEEGRDGSVAVQFGGCDGKITDCLPTMKGWHYMVRLYRPRAEDLDGSWKFPDARPVQ